MKGAARTQISQAVGGAEFRNRAEKFAGYASNKGCREAYARSPIRKQFHQGDYYPVEFLADFHDMDIGNTTGSIIFRGRSAWA